ncbi:MAG TPA: B12-binding domain-containing protein [Actinomycetes bacterium]
MQIGDLARRVGVRVDTLRAWERRYGLLHPHRSVGGFRLYSSDDEAIVRAMLSEIDRGYPPSQAAKLALASAGSTEGPTDRRTAALDRAVLTTAPADLTHLQVIRAELYGALLGFDGGRAHRLLDALLAEFTLNAVVRDVLLPCLRQIGEGWATGEVSVAEEHFASQLIRDRLLGLARDWDQGRGPRALLACPADERHDIALICFGVVLSRSGWRITFLGPDTPVTALADAVATLTPDLIVLSATVEERFTSIAAHLSALTSGANLVLAGPGASAAAAHATGAGLLEDEPVAAAVTTAARLPVPGPPHPTSHARNTRA